MYFFSPFPPLLLSFEEIEEKNLRNDPDKFVCT